MTLPADPAVLFRHWLEEHRGIIVKVTRSYTTTPTDAADLQQELLEKLYLGIHALPDFDRALVLLSLDSLSYREMSEITGQNENQIGVALTRARKRLAQLMKGITDELE